MLHRIVFLKKFIHNQEYNCQLYYFVRWSSHSRSLDRLWGGKINPVYNDSSHESWRLLIDVFLIAMERPWETFLSRRRPIGKNEKAEINLGKVNFKISDLCIFQDVWAFVKWYFRANFILHWASSNAHSEMDFEKKIHLFGCTGPVSSGS